RRDRAPSGTALRCTWPARRHRARGPGRRPRFRCSPRPAPLDISASGGPGRMRRPPWNASTCRARPRRRARPRAGARAGRAEGREAERREHARATALAAFLQGITQVVAGDPEAGDASFQSAAGAGEAGAPDVAAEALCERSLLAMKRGDWACAQTLARQASTLLSRTAADDAFTAAVQALVALHRGDIPAVRQHLVSAQRLRAQFTGAY